jgi:iron complex transport system permease protein
MEASPHLSSSSSPSSPPSPSSSSRLVSSSPSLAAIPGPPARFSKPLLAGLFLLLVILFILDVAIGSIGIPVKEVFRILFSIKTQNPTWQYIVENIRIPKAFTAVLAGCGLSVSGLQMQTLFRNPLAGPDVLGITAGASLGVAIVMMAGGSITTLYTIKELGLSGSWLIIAAACLGSAGIMLLVVSISGTIRDNVMMLIIGVMIGTMTFSVVSIWQYFSSPELIKDYLLWTFGSLGGVTGSQLSILAVAVLAGLVISFLSSKLLDALLLGENYARSMGLSVQRARLIIICATSLLAGSVTAFCGPIGFIGIAVPHMARSLFNTSNHRILIPACCLIGTVLMLSCDMIAQLPGSETVLPINIITSLIGAPVVIWVILRRNNLRGY